MLLAQLVLWVEDSASPILQKKGWTQDSTTFVEKSHIELFHGKT